MSVRFGAARLSLATMLILASAFASAQGLDLGGLINELTRAPGRIGREPYPRQYEPRPAAPVPHPRNEFGDGVGEAAPPSGRARQSLTLPAAAAATSRFNVGEFTLGGYVDRATLPDAFSCEPSHDFAGFTWCRKRQRSGKGLTMNSILISREGRIAYVSKYVEPADFAPGEISGEITRLDGRWGTKARVLTPPSQADAPDAVIATWGGIALKPLGEGDLRLIAAGQAAGLGLVIDFLGDAKASARQGLPVYRIEGGPGFFWIAHHGRTSRGNLRFGAVDASYSDRAQQGSFAEAGPPRSVASGPVADVFAAESALPQQETEPTPGMYELLLMKARPDLYTTDLDALHYLARQFQSNSRECSDLRNAEDDEISIGPAIAQARQAMRRGLDEARRFDASILIRKTDALPIGAYDPARSILNFDPARIKGTFVDRIASFSQDFDRVAGACHVSPSPRALRQISDPLLHQHRLTIKFVGGDRIRSLNVDPQMAKALIRDVYSRPPRLSARIRLGLLGTNIVGKIVSAQAIAYQIINSGPVQSAVQTVTIQDFPPSVFAGLAVNAETFDTETRSSEGHGFIPSSAMALILNAVRLKPDYIPDGKLLNRLPSIISNEQSAYKAARVTNERPPDALFEADQIVGREPSFAANDLLPEFRRRIRQLSAGTSNRLRSGLTLSAGGVPYDFGTAELVLSRYHPLLLGLPRDVGIGRLTSGARLNLAAVPLVDGYILYEPSPSRLDGDQGPSLARSLELTLGEVNTPALALDRLLTTPNLPMAAARAEALAKATTGNATIQSVVNYTIQGTAAGPNGALVLLGHVIDVAVLGPQGQELLRLEAEKFPPASVVSDAKQDETAAAASRDEARRSAERTAIADVEQARRLDEAHRAAGIEQAKRDKERRIVAAQERPEGGFGPVIARVQLGMPMAEAEGIVRQTMKVAAVLEVKPDAWAYAPSLVSPKVFVSENAGTIVSLTPYGDQEPRVVAVAQRVSLPVPPISQTDLTTLLTDKYGPAASNSGNTMNWAAGLKEAPRPCHVIQSDAPGGFVVTEGSLPPMRNQPPGKPADQYASAGYIGLFTFRVPNPTNAVDELRECPTTTVAVFDLNPTDPSLKTGVFDGGWLAKMIADGLKTTRPAGNQAVKDLLNQ